MALGSLTSTLPLVTRTIKIKHGTKCVTNIYCSFLSIQQPPQFVNKHTQKLHTITPAIQWQPYNTNPTVINYGLIPCQKYSTSPTPESSEDNKQEESIDDLRSLLKDKSLGLTQKFKIVFQQYGVVAVCVHLVNTTFWVSVIYTALSHGVDILPVLDNLGVFDFLEKLGFSYTESLKSNGEASYWLATYLVYEIIKIPRCLITLFGTMYAVRALRRFGYLKPVPKTASVGDVVDVQTQIIKRQIKQFPQEYREWHRKRLKRFHAFQLRKRATWLSDRTNRTIGKKTTNGTNGNNGQSAPPQS